MNDQKLKVEVNRFRDQNGLGTTDAIRLKSLLVHLNVVAVFKPLNDKFSGMAIKSNEFRFILINNNQTIGKQHFTIAHELFHLFIQEQFTSMVCNAGYFNKKDQIEYIADRFSAHLLLPEQGVSELIPDKELNKNKITLETIVKIEQFYSVSRRALLYRLEELGIIEKSYSELFKNEVIKSAAILGYPVDLYQPGNQGLIIGDYGEKAKRLFDAEKISEGQYAGLMIDIGIDVFSESGF